MVERSRRNKRKQKLLASHQRSWLWGRNLVCATLASGRWPIIELHLADDLPPDQLHNACTRAKELSLYVRIEDRAILERLGHTSEHQGFLAKMGPFPYASADELFASATAAPLFLVLDSIHDPYNFGAMLRSAGGFGASGVFIGGDGQVPVTSMVARSSAGIVNHVPIARVDDIRQLVATLRLKGIRVIGTSGAAQQPLTECDFRGGTAIVIGNEGTGIRTEVIAVCDELVRIPLADTVSSLNAAAAAAVLQYEVWRQRHCG